MRRGLRLRPFKTLDVALPSHFRAAGVLEGIHHGFFEPHPIKMRFLEAAVQYFKDLDAEIFRGGHSLREFLQRIQILQIVARHYFLFDETVEIDQIADHASALIDLAADGDFESVIVAVSMRIVTFAIGGAILFRGHGGAVQPVRGGEAIAAGEMSFHGGFWLLASGSYASP